jgi:predicted Zn-dependent peptidase
VLRTSEVPARLVAAQTDLMARQLEQSNRQNAAVAGRIALKYAYGEDVAELAALTDIYRRIDAPAIQHAAQMYLNPSQYVQVVMMPESARR